jgi:ABC-2 type transport system permease protein
VPLWIAYALMLAFVAVLGALSLWLLRRGVGLRS